MKVVKTYLSRPLRPGSAVPTVAGVLALLAVSLVFWIGPDAVSNLLDGQRAQIFGHGQYWRLWTAIGAHADPHHLLSNLPFFAIFGFLLYGYFGAWAFPILPIAFGGAVNALTLLAYPPGASLVGASGVVYLMAGLWLGLFVLVERRRSLGERMASVACFALVLLMPETFDPKTSYLAHAIGFGIGALLAPVLYAFQRRAILAAEVRYTPLEMPAEHEHHALPGTEPYYWLPRAERPVSDQTPEACEGCAV